MVERQLRRRGIRDPRVLEAFGSVPREAFVDAADQASAYDDRPLSIGAGQTISQPYVVAIMIEAVAPQAADRVLEVGAGSGYAAALLACLAARVYAVERQPRLAAAARERLTRLGCANVDLRAADGTQGLPEVAPFDVILVSAGGPAVPPPLIDQLTPGGRLVMPVGGRREQRLLRVTKSAVGTIDYEDLGAVSFVPLLGDIGSD
jgi:protein-L-isoaspartate(D-aspartate) O-methyltransferase